MVECVQVLISLAATLASYNDPLVIVLGIIEVFDDCVIEIYLQAIIN